jgi:hypothetical protein
VAPGVYRLVETEAPAGYLAAAPLTGVEVDPGATTVLDVENAFAPPPPDTGSLQVVKFVCPAGEDGEGTFIYDSSNAGGGKLGRTVGCERGDARFGLIDLDGPNPPLEFATGADGRYQATLRRGTYRLSELAPDLPGEAVEDVAVSVNQLTTVVVLNFVAPPPPASGSIEVVKFTCAPGLQGVLFEDFVNGCAENGALTNNVTVRVAGPVTARRVTGDGGEQGITRFANLPPGDYRVSEEVNPNVAQTVYSFCGLNPDALNLRGVGPTTDIRVGSGQTLVCYLFNVPDLVTETTGTIVVHKYACAANTYPPGFDWFGQCRPQGAGVRFAVSVFNGETFAPKATGATDADGILRFTDAAPGTYQLREIGAAWCRAESDSVDANGNVIVRAGERANVWIFNCLGTKAPPNTGAGPLALGATLPATVSVAPLSGGVAGLALLWPVAGFGLLSGLRRWAGGRAHKDLKRALCRHGRQKGRPTATGSSPWSRRRCWPATRPRT